MFQTSLPLKILQEVFSYYTLGFLITVPVLAGLLFVSIVLELELSIETLATELNYIYDVSQINRNEKRRLLKSVLCDVTKGINLSG